MHIRRSPAPHSRPARPEIAGHSFSRRRDRNGAAAGATSPRSFARCGVLRDCRYLLHDRDTKYTQSFRTIIASGRVVPLFPRNKDIHRDGAVQCRERLGGLLRYWRDGRQVLGELCEVGGRVAPAHTTMIAGKFTTGLSPNFACATGR